MTSESPDKLRNPYAPPVAVVADADTETPRVLPRAVRRAAILMLASFALDSVIVGLEWRYLAAPESLLEMFLGQSMALAATGLLAWKIASGRNWARIVVLVLTVISVPVLFADAITTAPSVAAIAGLKLVELGFDIAVVYLVFFPGRDFFKQPSP